MPDQVTTTQARVVSAGHTFLEGPRWRDGALIVSDFYSERVLEFRPTSDGTHAVREVCSVPGRPSGLGFAPDGSLWIVSMLRRAVVRWDGDTLSDIADFGHLVDGVANDMHVFASGWAFVGNFGNTDAEPDSLAPTDLVRISPTGEVDLAGVSVVFPNGMVDTGEEFIVAETFAGRLTAFALTTDADGGPVLGSARAWKRFGGASASDAESGIGSAATTIVTAAAAQLDALPDGLALDASGAVWVASSNGHQALRVSATGELLETVDVGELAVYALALGGEAGTTLYLCCSPPLGEHDPTSTTASVLMAAEVAVPSA